MALKPPFVEPAPSNPRDRVTIAELAEHVDMDANTLGDLIATLIGNEYAVEVISEAEALKHLSKFKKKTLRRVIPTY